mmetsp:Transcript_7443/g.12501  ORF Transcript_7443/g.12501 Transcript_7443/m.12501 type:complete len:124 (-) Transcript_7443:245-616(-)
MLQTCSRLILRNGRNARRVCAFSAPPSFTPNRNITRHMSFKSALSGDDTFISTSSSTKLDEENDEFDIQPHWKSMESRVVKRKLVPATEETRRRGARGRVPPTEEEFWSRAGAYSSTSGDKEH